jgi:hypothetical protein
VNLVKTSLEVVAVSVSILFLRTAWIWRELPVPVLHHKLDQEDYLVSVAHDDIPLISIGRTSVSAQYGGRSAMARCRGE